MNRRQALLLLGSGTFSVSCASLKPASGADKRLLGTWRSDKERTLKGWCYSKEIKEETRRKFEGMFGKLTLRITETHAHITFDEKTSSTAYHVVAADERSVVVAWHEEAGEKLQQIFFEDDYYYIVAGRNVEFFKRVEA